jgi:hypothetical protein
MSAGPLSLQSLLAASAFLAGAPGVAAALDTAAIQGLLYSTFLTNLSIAFTIVLLFIFGLYAYASLARFAPYHTWIYLYLVSLAGVVWALFLLNNGGSLSDVVFLLTTVVGINLIVHVLRYDRIQLSVRAVPAGVPQQAEEPNPILSWNPPRF